MPRAPSILGNRIPSMLIGWEGGFAGAIKAKHLNACRL